MPTPTVAANILGGGRSSRLFKALVYDQQIAQSVTVQQNSLTLGIDVHDRSDRAPGQDAGAARGGDQRRAREVPHAGPDAAEVDRAHNTIETASSTVCNDSAALAASPIASTPTSITSAIPDYLPRISRAIVRRRRRRVKAFAREVPDDEFAGRRLRRARARRSSAPEVPKPAAPTGGGQTAEGVNADEPWRSTKPAAGPPRR